MSDKESFETKAVLRFVKVSPLKVNRILRYIRNRSVEEALIILNFMPHKSSFILKKLILSAFSNLNKDFELFSSSFKIQEAKVNPAPFLKRMSPRAQGRGFAIKKRFSHIVSPLNLKIFLIKHF